jgi:hypothetical protein
MTKAEASRRFRALVAIYGMRWTGSVPKAAWDELAEINKVLTENDRRAALKGE